MDAPTAACCTAVVVFEKGERLDLGWMDTLGFAKK